MTSSGRTHGEAGVALTRRNVLGGALIAASLAAAGAAGGASAAVSPAQALAARTVVPRMAFTSLGASAYAHPGLLHTASDLGDLATRVVAGSQPWFSGYERLAAKGAATPRGIRARSRR